MSYSISYSVFVLPYLSLPLCVQPAPRCASTLLRCASMQAPPPTAAALPCVRRPSASRPPHLLPLPGALCRCFKISADARKLRKLSIPVQTVVVSERRVGPSYFSNRR